MSTIFLLTPNFLTKLATSRTKFLKMVRNTLQKNQGLWLFSGKIAYTDSSFVIQGEKRLLEKWDVQREKIIDN